MRELALAQARAHAGRYVASILAVVIAVGYIVATLTLNSTVDAGINNSLAAQYQGTDAVASGPGATAADLARVPGVAATTDDVSAYIRVDSAIDGKSYGDAISIADDSTLRWQQVSDGELPTGLGEALVSKDADIPVGSEIIVTAPGASDGASTSVRVVGLVDLSGTAQRMRGTTVFATPAQLFQWAGDAAEHEVRIAGDGSLSQQELATRVRASLPADSTVVTGAAATKNAAGQYLGQAELLSTILLSFGAIAVVVAALVIANTFAVLLAARTQELALLRCVGATASQVRRSIRTEAAAVGIIASVLGAGVGIALAWVVGRVATAADAPIPLSTLDVDSVSIGAGVAVGIVMTMVAASAPGRAATRLSPLAALQPMETKPESARMSFGRKVLGLGALAAGVAATVMGVFGQQVLVATVGGLLSFLGIALLSITVVPALISRAGIVLARLAGPVGELAAGNAGRNPRRTSATATALLIGVALTSTLVVGIATVKSTAPAAMDEQFPVDVMVSSTGNEGLPPELGPRIEGTAGVAGVSGLERAGLVLDGRGELDAFGVSGSAAQSVLRTPITLPAPGQLVLSPAGLRDYDLSPGDTVTVRGDRDAVTLTVAEGLDGQPALLDHTDMSSAASPVIDAFWIRLSDGNSDEQSLTATDQVTEVARELAPGSDVQGMIAMRSAIDSVLDTMLMVVAGLLSVAVLIALIGVGNTMALSVLERSRESGLLRALGLTRKGVRAMLIWEAVLVTGVASVMGVVFGLIFGAAGTASVFGYDDVALSAIPWLQLFAIAAIGGVCGVIAALLPARRAGAASPVAALSS
ncbi:ABC transporter permease [Rhodococcus tibetensis]|uniref:FtsX-like permease family protein n=1 Tax=Rhodococcus tibetensis TaxID=2965064 RepID=A0ABT1Q6S9_9NOCA|nr:FtsX-like permease family protein [Rhodococcus sp. FXJ9.536]MCQ4117952.1 FtsX-like permease family protein [Rhodococcus sp. FXJ9.536]